MSRHSICQSSRIAELVVPNFYLKDHDFFDAVAGAWAQCPDNSNGGSPSRLLGGHPELALWLSHAQSLQPRVWTAKSLHGSLRWLGPSGFHIVATGSVQQNCETGAIDHIDPESPCRSSLCSEGATSFRTCPEKMCKDLLCLAQDLEAALTRDLGSLCLLTANPARVSPGPAGATATGLSPGFW